MHIELKVRMASFGPKLVKKAVVTMTVAAAVVAVVVAARKVKDAAHASLHADGTSNHNMTTQQLHQHLPTTMAMLILHTPLTHEKGRNKLSSGSVTVVQRL